jgi:leucyl aminopeptidase (aminopeptidase T)
MQLIIDDYKKISKFKTLSSKMVQNIIKIYDIKKNNTILIWCDTGFRGKKASPIMAKTFYDYFKKNGFNVSVVVEKPKLKTGFSSDKINNAVKLLKKDDVFVSLSSGQAVFLHKNGKGINTRDFMQKKGVKVIVTNGLGSLKSKYFDHFLQSYNSDQGEIKKLGDKLKKLFEKTKIVKITCPLGTNLLIKFDKRIVINNFGNPEYDTNFPVGETYTAPLEGTTNGIAFVKSSKVLGETYLHKKPVKYVFENGLLVKTSFKKLDSALFELEKFNEEKGIKQAYKKVRNVAEFAIGTNKKARFIGLMINDEKIFGTCHIGLGDSSHFGGKIFCNGHSDHVIEKPTIYFDNKKIVEKGKFVFLK